VRHCGATSVAALLAATIAQTQSQIVCVTYTGDGQALQEYINVSPQKDPSRSLRQAARMLASNSISEEELLEYCTLVSTNVYFLNTDDDLLTSDDISLILSQIFSKVTTDFSICDITTDLDSNITKTILNLCDVIILVTDMSRNSIELTKRYRASKMIPQDKHICAVVNKFDPGVVSLAQVAAELGTSSRFVCKLQYSSLVVRACRTQQLIQLASSIISYDYRVVALNTGLKELLQFICSVNGKRLKWDNKIVKDI
jgi:CO dehydrogenase nickel-insertion accessory protein CooC1